MKRSEVNFWLAITAGAGLYFLAKPKTKSIIAGMEDEQLNEPEYLQFKGKWRQAIKFLIEQKKGIAVAALKHPALGDVDIVWGKAGDSRQHGYGLAKIVEYHPEVLENIQPILSKMTNMRYKGAKGYDLKFQNYKATVREVYNGKERRWLMTMFEAK